MTEDTPNKPTHKFNTPEPDAFLGMTRRDYFIGAAITGLISAEWMSLGDPKHKYDQGERYDILASNAVCMADQLLDEADWDGR